MESGGSFRPGSHPGEAAMRQAKQLASLPAFEQAEGAGGAEVHFAWDRDLILVYAEDLTTVREVPLKATFEKYATQLKENAT